MSATRRSSSSSRRGHCDGSVVQSTKSRNWVSASGPAHLSAVCCLGSYCSCLFLFLHLPPSPLSTLLYSALLCSAALLLMSLLPPPPPLSARDATRLRIATSHYILPLVDDDRNRNVYLIAAATAAAIRRVSCSSLFVLRRLLPPARRPSWTSASASRDDDDVKYLYMGYSATILPLRRLHY